MRCCEATSLKFNDIEIHSNKFVVTVNDTKTYIDRQFIIGPLFYDVVQKYINLRPSDSPDRFFLHYAKGKCNRQPIGKNKIGEIPHDIAVFLELPSPKKYTGHSFRRTGATLLSDSGANVQALKQLGGWRSEAVALGYVEKSMHAKQNIFNGITHASTSNQQTNTPPPSSAPIPATKNSTATENNSFVLDWDDFSEEFVIDNTGSEPPSTAFVTAAGAVIEIPEEKNSTALLLPIIQESEHSEAGTSSAVGKVNQQTKPKSILKSGLDLSGTPELSLPPNKQPFFEKKPIKLNFHSSASSQPPLKKRLLVHPTTSMINEDALNNNSPAKYENCTFNNCTFNFK